MLEIFSSNPDFKKFIAIMIAIENPIRINQGLILFFNRTLSERKYGDHVMPGVPATPRFFMRAEYTNNASSPSGLMLYSVSSP